MRISLTLIFTVFYLVSFAQPSNDECANAITLNVNAPTPCPGSSPAVDVFTYNNNGATPTTPYPSFSNCNPGGQTSSPADEVWFSFTPGGNTNTVDVAINGLNTPNVVLFSGNDCGFLQAIACGASMSGAGTVNINSLVQAGNTYFIMVSGGNVGDQGNFDITIMSSEDCAQCLQATDFFGGPPPNNGTYSSGQTVNFCFTINQWDLTGTVEWLHAVTFQFGPGWDMTTLSPSPVPSCDGDGQWGWYDSWVGCNTGDVFGPGFAYDSSNGVGCGGSPNDGDPGNNWGDGDSNCSTITPANPFVFCFSINVSNCPPNITGNSLSVQVSVHSDGESGSWTAQGCNTTAEPTLFLASAICCDDAPPLVIPTPTSCPGTCDGSLMVTPGGGTGTGPWNVNIFDATNNLVFSASTVSGTINVPGLCAGNYSVLTTNVLTACDRSAAGVVPDGFPPDALASNSGPFCPGSPIFLFGSTTGVGAPITYSWQGPNGYISFQQNPTDATEAGTYTLTVNVAGCESMPATTEVVIQPAAVAASASEETVCIGTQVQLFGSGAVSYDWGLAGTGSPIIVTPFVTTTYMVTGTDANGCVATDEITITVNPLPTVQIDVSGILCEGEFVLLTASGAQTYAWANGGPNGPAYLTMPSPPSETFSVLGTDANGCQNFAEITLNISSPPNAQIMASATEVCSGDPVTLTATGGTDYEWSTGDMTDVIVVNPTVTTTYSVIVSDGNGCETSTDIEITVDDPLPDPVISCGPSTPSSVEFNWNAVTDATGYNVTILTPQTGGMLNGTSFTLDGLSPGETVTIEVVALGGGICGSSTATFSCTTENCPNVDIMIDPVPDICLDANTGTIDLEVTVTGGNGTGTGIWSGNCVIDPIEGIINPVMGGPGVDSVFFTFTEGLCVYMDTLLINIFATPIANLDASSNLVCTDEEVTINFTGITGGNGNFTWDFDGGAATPGTGQGPQSVSWDTPGTFTVTVFVTENGCMSNVASVEIMVEEPLPDPNISCGASTTTSVEFTWDDIPGATFSVNVTSGQTGTQDGNTFTVDNLMPGEAVTIEVIADNGGPCGTSMSTITCNADDCPVFAISIDPVNDICLDATAAAFDLMVEVTGGDGSGTGTWSGDGITDPDAGTFDPNDAGVGTHTITYTYEEGPCNGSESIDIVVNPQPTADFTVDPDVVCIDTPITIEYTGDADASATYTWNFNGGDANPGTGQGPHSVSWTTSGTKTITLIVEAENCASEQFTQTVTVEDPLPEPVVNCNTSTSSIEFFWEDVPGADSYNVTVITAHTGTLDGNTFTVTGLSPDEVVTIQVEAIGMNACGSSMTEASCTAQNCPDITIDIDAVADICLDASAAPITLNATLTGDDGTGTIVWDGPGITDMDNGTFDPTDAGAGTATINYTYTQGNCSYNATTSITINEQPTAEFTIDSPICIDGTASVVYTGTAAPDADYNWNFGDGIADPGTGPGPHEVSWPNGGMQTISLTVTQADCASESFEQDTQVDVQLAEPVITCNTSTTEIVFSWEDVPGADSYNVTVISGQAGTIDGNSITISSLVPGDNVTVQVEAIGPTSCGSSTAEAICTAQDCETINVSITPIEVCEDAGIQTLEATLDGGAGNGTFVWSGTGIVDADAGTFDPSMLSGDIDIMVIYTEGVCDYNGMGTVSINTIPSAEFSLVDPICVDASTTVTYDGDASTLANFDWDFGGGVANPGTGPGPHEVTWPDGGMQTISLRVTENDCVSELVSQTLQVDVQLAEPVITCETTDNSITFSWEDVPGATDYEVEVLNGGPTGMLTGNTYAVTSLLPNDEVTIQVTATGPTVCGPSVTQATCVAQDCPALSVALTGTDAICEGETATLTFDFNANSNGPFTVIYSVNGADNETVTVENGETIDVNPAQTSEYEIISVTDNGLADCMYPGNVNWTITVNETVNSGTDATPLQLCAFENTVVNLEDLLIGADPGGIWMEVSTNPSTGFNASNGTFDATNQTGGFYNFAYVIDAAEPCPDAETIVTVELQDAPVADAGEDQDLTCNMGMVSLGGSETTSGTGITYTWTSDDPDLVITDPDAQFTEVGQEGTFILTVSNQLGCSSTDEVMVSSEFGVPVADVSIRDISCFQSNDGAIIVENVAGGTGPYSFSLNGGDFTNQTFYSELGPGAYSLVISDQNGCSSELMIDFTQPEEVVVNLIAVLEDSDRLQLGDSVQLIAQYDPNLAIDTIMWEPDTIGMGNSAAIWVSPEESTQYTVTIIDTSGCTDEDRITVIVEKVRPVYIPNAFSPNEDGANDVFFIHAGEEVKEVKSFAVFNRWGEPMIELFKFQPNDPSFGWDGMHRGKPMNPAVFAYFAEIEFDDGEIILYEGDVVLMK